MSSPNTHTAEENALTALAALEDLVKRLEVLITDTEKKTTRLERRFSEEDAHTAELNQAESAMDDTLRNSAIV